ncbi:putative biopolymer transport protein TolR [Candidatus Protochlamydia naegleriophila]|uniref:Putative biopolymer transport protein TolR n=1 Tax=Candidatus Protochlamydia naegleriophila TaxID=389348 RepID=A0A0U5EU56_9BACT|nr:biopolymer transporter ExbD [Candidatus Protochlamydia naegleriophila]CUI17811.1 putative biopolymer transport protein TolR [Candidatus Protochlamydia naegleriophila]
MTRSRLSFPHSSAHEEPTVNLTPLIDVVFVILIMFIVIAPLLEQDRVELADAPHLPLQSTQSVQESSPITVHVHADNTIWFNLQPTTLYQLVEQLKEAKTHYPTVTPQIFHDKKAHFGTYQSVKNAAEEAGFSKMDIILKPA